jgi:hypothetical protein
MGEGQMTVDAGIAQDNRIIAQLGEWDAIIEKLKKRAEKVDPEMRIEYMKLLAALRDKRNAIKARLRTLDYD